MRCRSLFGAQCSFPIQKREHHQHKTITKVIPRSVMSRANGGCVGKALRILVSMVRDRGVGAWATKGCFFLLINGVRLLFYSCPRRYFETTWCAATSATAGTGSSPFRAEHAGERHQSTHTQQPAWACRHPRSPSPHHLRQLRRDHDSGDGQRDRRAGGLQQCMNKHMRFTDWPQPHPGPEAGTRQPRLHPA
jgi:hypothetical protein